MDAASMLRAARHRGRLSLRQLARLADTSHATLSAYEGGNKVPTVATLARILRAAGYEVEAELVPVAGGLDRLQRGRELAEALDLAARFPARHAPFLSYPRFGRAT